MMIANAEYMLNDDSGNGSTYYTFCVGMFFIFILQKVLIFFNFLNISSINPGPVEWGRAGTTKVRLTCYKV